MDRYKQAKRRASREVSDVIGGENNTLKPMLQHARQLQRLDEAFRRLLPEGLSDHVQVANHRDGCLVLITPVAAIATRLQLERVQLVDQLRQKGFRGLKEIKVLIEPPVRHKIEQRRTRELTETAKSALAAMGVKVD